jgi:hypothetical protein
MKIGEWAKAQSELERIFHVRTGQLYDGQVTFIFKKIGITPFVFDEHLHELYGDYEEAGWSMKDLVLDKYGAEGYHLLTELL